ncbi:MAG: CHASE domain-containing protein [Methylococcaceae bacterium]
MLRNFAQRPFFIYFLQIVGIAAAYFIAGKLGNLLVIPPNYATVVFPSSGVALAGVLLYGKRVGFGILLGAFLLNSSIAVTASDLSESLNSAFITLAIAGGATLQAFVGAYLIERFAATPNFLSCKKNILLFFFLGGFVSALINSTLSVSLLVAIGRMSADTFFSNWLYWWGGDALGIIIFAPLMLIWLAQKNPVWQGRKWKITTPILTLFFLTIAVISYDIKISNERTKMEFEQRTKELALVLKTSINTKLNVLHTLHSFYVSSLLVDRNEFRLFVSEQLGNFEGIKAVQWVPIILAANRDAYEKSVQKEGFPNFQITERDLNNNMTRAATRPEYAPIDFNEPTQGNEIVSGFDNYSSQLRHDLLNNARDTNRLTVSPPITLMDKRDSLGFVAYMPIYKPNLPIQNLQERRDAITSYLVAVFRAGDLVMDAFKNQNLTNFSYRLSDINAPADKQLLFASDDFNLLKENESLIKLNASNELMTQLKFNVGGRVWQFEIIPTPYYFVQHNTTNIHSILLVGFGLMIFTITNALIFGMRDYEKEITAIQLSIFNEELTVQIAEKNKRTQELLESNEKNKILDNQILHMQKLESIGRLTSGMAHEFNNILGCIIGYNELNQYVSEDMTEENLKAELDNNIKQVNLAVKRADDLINKMLTYCRQDELKIKKDVQPTQEVIHKVLDILRPGLTSRIKINFLDTCNINGEDCDTCGLKNLCETNVQMDAIDLEQVLINLMTNARDSMQKRGGIISVSVKLNRVKAFCVACSEPLDGDFIELSVVDNGDGIEQKFISRLFDPFFTTKPQGEGTGLGLSTTSGIVHRADGHILVTSHQGEFNHGTTFRLLFPIA